MNIMSKPRKAQKVEYTTEFPHFRKLVEKYGHTEASRKIGFSDSYASEVFRAGKIRPCSEMAAELVLRDETPRSERVGTAYIVKLTGEDSKLVLPMLDRMGVIYMDLDL